MAEGDSVIPETSSKQDHNADQQTESILTSVVMEIVSSPLNLILTAIIAILLYKIIKSHTHVPKVTPPEPQLPKLRKDFTPAELKPFNGTQGDGRILIGVNGNVYDVTKAKRFYGPGGPYAAFGGRDASRGLATFSVAGGKDDEYDDLSDLSNMEMDSVREWEAQFKEKYDLVGRLLKPGEEPTNYSEEEEEEKVSAEGASENKPKSE